MHVIDHATRLSACAFITNKLRETIIRELFRIWISVYGFPEKFLSDNGDEFANHKFRELCEAAISVVKTTAAESPWSNGLCERHNLVISEMVVKTMDDTGCSLPLAVAWSVNAKNSLAILYISAGVHLQDSESDESGESEVQRDVGTLKLKSLSLW